LKANWPKWSESPSPVGEWQPWGGVKIARHVIGFHYRTMTMPLGFSPKAAYTLAKWGLRCMATRAMW
jgi:hypothetical protein